MSSQPKILDATAGGRMSGGTQWLNEITARLEAVKAEYPYEDKDRHAKQSAAWSDLYQHAPTDLRRLIAEVERLETELANKETQA